MRVLFFLLLSCAMLPLQALDRTKIHRGLTREEAGRVLPSDYSYKVLSDATVRRSWSGGDGGNYSLDFDPRSGKLLAARIRYAKPVSMRDATRDMQKIGRTSASDWKKGVASKMRHIGFSKAQWLKLADSTFFFAQQNSSGKVTALHFFTSTPRSNRYALSEGETEARQTAMGASSGGGEQRIAALVQQEAQLRRQAQSSGSAIARVDTTSKPSAKSGLAAATTPSSAQKGAETAAAEGDSMDTNTLLAIAGGGLLLIIILAMAFSGGGKKKRR